MNKRLANAFWVGAAFVGCVLAADAGAADVNQLVAVCADCHGAKGASKDPEVPIIGGYSTEFVTNNLKAYQTKERDCPETKFVSGPKKGTKTDMCQIVKNLSPADIKEIAGYFYKQKFVRAKQKFDPALAQKGKQLHEDYCEKCHTQGGTVADDDVGLPAGQWMPYLRKAMKEFKSGARPIAKKMKAKLDEVDDAGVEALINYYGSIQ
ncbi:MAG TPA: c-type cytochrome [Rhodocyclaceae bacterium]|nr:c-type cytochrome [Rhodocyclaceae bacterium]